MKSFSVPSRADSSCVTDVITRNAFDRTICSQERKLKISLICGEKAEREITLDLHTLSDVHDNLLMNIVQEGITTTISRLRAGEDVLSVARTPLQGTNVKRPRLRVYCAGPMLGSGNPYVNVARGLDVGVLLLERGLAPYTPQLTALLEMTKGTQDRETWMELDHAFLVVCDALLRLPGESPGADQECAWALDRGIPVFTSLDTLFAWEVTRR